MFVEALNCTLETYKRNFSGLRRWMTRDFKRASHVCTHSAQFCKGKTARKREHEWIFWIPDSAQFCNINSFLSHLWTNKRKQFACQLKCRVLVALQSLSFFLVCQQCTMSPMGSKCLCICLCLCVCLLVCQNKPLWNGFTVGAPICNVTSGQRTVVVVVRQTNSDERHPIPCLAALFIVALNF